MFTTYFEMALDLNNTAWHNMGLTRRTRLVVQYINQLSVLLVALKKVHEEPRRIGFELMKSVETDEGQGIRWLEPKWT